MTMNDLAPALKALGLHATAAGLEDLLATATEHCFGPRALLEHVVRTETAERAQRSLERRTLSSRIGTFKPIADFDKPPGSGQRGGRRGLAGTP
jgi:hypothetical protein